jgi:hypothetical protein
MNEQEASEHLVKIDEAISEASTYTLRKNIKFGQLKAFDQNVDASIEALKRAIRLLEEMR